MVRTNLLSKAVRRNFLSDTGFLASYFFSDAISPQEGQRRFTEDFDETLTISVDGNIVSVKFIHPDPVVAADGANQFVEYVNKVTVAQVIANVTARVSVVIDHYSRLYWSNRTGHFNERQ